MTNKQTADTVMERSIMLMNSTKEIKVHDIVWVKAGPLRNTNEQFGYAEVMSIAEDKAEGITYYGVRFHGFDTVYVLEDRWIYPV